MPGRIGSLVNGEYYHIFNRGVEKRNIYSQNKDYQRFRKTFFYYQFLGPKPSFSKFSKTQLNQFKPLNENKLVEILCYCLMPNHFHFLVRQLKNNGISIFVSLISNSYTKYFNVKYERIGPLLQGVFKAVHIETDEQLIHLSRYIHLNPIVSGLVKNLDDHCWSSYLGYKVGKSSLCSIDEILSFFESEDDYRKFVEDQIEYGTTLEILKHQLLDVDEF